MSGTSPEPDRPLPHGRRNFWLAVTNGALSMGGIAFFAPETVMAGLVHVLTGSAVCVGLMSSIFYVGWLWPQIFVGNLIEHRQRKMPVYILSAVLRLVGLYSVAAAVYFWWGSPMALFVVILALVALYSSAGQSPTT